MTSFRRTLLAVALLVLAGAGAAPQAKAFRVEAFRPGAQVDSTGSIRAFPTSVFPLQFWHWDLREFVSCQVPYSINAAGTADSGVAGGFDALVNSFGSWNGVTPTPLTFSRQPNTAAAVGARDGVNLIAWDGGKPENLAVLGTSDDGTLAVTLLWTSADSSTILESDIIFNDRDYQWNNTGDDFLNVFTSKNNPFALADSDSVVVKVDNGAAITVRFLASQFGDIGSASALEVGNRLMAALPAAAITYVDLGGGDSVIVIKSKKFDGTGYIEIVGGTAAPKLGLPIGKFETNSADIQTVATHEIGHLLGLHHTSQDPNEANAVDKNAIMYYAAPSTGTKRVLTPDDRNGMNFLYTWDLGDASSTACPDYPTLVHTETPSRTLSGLQLFRPGNGPAHLFNFMGVDSLKFEWLGANMDESLSECEARVPNQDNFDDGVTFPSPLIRGAPNDVTVTISFQNAARYNRAIVARTLHLNGYFDFDGDCVLDGNDLQCGWSGDATGTTFQFNLKAPPVFGPNSITLTFSVTPPANAAGTGFARFRLDLGEDDGRPDGVRPGGVSLGLRPAQGVAQFGEVEDYPFATQAAATAAELFGLQGLPRLTGYALSWMVADGARFDGFRVLRAPSAEGPWARVDELTLAASARRYEDLPPAGIWYYRVEGLRGSDQPAQIGPLRAEIRSAPWSEYQLLQPAPNPFRQEVRVAFVIQARASKVDLGVYDLSGRRVASLFQGLAQAGRHEVMWDGRLSDGSRAAAAVYFIRLSSPAGVRTQRVALLR